MSDQTPPSSTDKSRSAPAWPPTPTAEPLPPLSGEGTADIREFERQNEFLLLLLLIVTLGLYAPFWMLRTAKVVDRVIPSKAIPIPLIWTLLCLQIANFVVAFAAGMVGVTAPSMARLFHEGDQAVGLLVGVFGLFLAFWFRGTLNAVLERTAPKLRGFGTVGTFFFGVLYLQIRLNQRIKEREAQVLAAR
ncbi:MAG: hypothetical protein P4L33_00855 [Capsulimonadaceae bacterium]|nr:hypothetical protein [Capsulimonadaceae bacterium]